MLEGNELEKKLGEYGEVIVDVDDKLILTVGVNAKVDLIAELEKLAAKSGKEWLGKAVGMLKGFLSK